MSTQASGPLSPNGKAKVDDAMQIRFVRRLPLRPPERPNDRPLLRPMQQRQRQRPPSLLDGTQSSERGRFKMAGNGVFPRHQQSVSLTGLH